MEVTGALIDFGSLKLSVSDTGVLVRLLLTVLMLCFTYVTFYKDKKHLANFYENELKQLQIAPGKNHEESDIEDDDIEKSRQFS